MSGQLHAQTALPSAKELVCPLNRRLGGLQSRSGRLEKMKIFLPLPRLEPWIDQPVVNNNNDDDDDDDDDDNSH